MNITYVGHSCFLIEDKDYRIVIDPYQSNYVPGLADVALEADEVLCTHGHGDHAGRDEVRLRGNCSAENSQNSGSAQDSSSAQGSEISSSSRNSSKPFVIRKLASFHDFERGRLRGPNDIILLEAEGRKIVHMGDVCCRIDEIAENELIRNADVMMMPVGGTYTVDPAQACKLAKELSPKILIPMHYRTSSSGFDDIAYLEDFVSKYDGDAKLVVLGQLRRGDENVNLEI